MRFRPLGRSPVPPPAPPEELADGPQLPADPSLQGDPPLSAPLPPVVVPRWVQLVLLPIALLGLWALARAAGRVLLILLAASTIALILNPLVKMLQRRRVPHGVAILLIYLGFFAALGGVGVLLANPVSTQVSPPRAQRSQLHQDRQSRSRELPAVAQPARDQGPDPAAGPHRAADAREERAQGLGQRRLVLARSAGQARHHRVRPRAGVRAVDLPARVRRGNRRPGQAADAARRRDGRRRLPAAGSEGGVRLRARPAAVQPDHGLERGARPVDLRGHRHLPRRSALRPVPRRLLRADGVHPVHRADHRARPGRAHRAVQRPDQRGVGGDPVRRPPAARGPHRRPPGVPASPCGSTRS